VRLDANGDDLLFLLNHGDVESAVDLGERTVTLEPLGVALVEALSPAGSGRG